MHVVSFFKSDHSAPSGGRLNFRKKTDLTLQTFIYVDEGFSKTVWQNSMRHMFKSEQSNSVFLLKCNLPPGGAA